jgi:hypothetical protein
MNKDVLGGDEWYENDVPAVIPKRLWDSVLDGQESIVALADATCDAAIRLIDANKNEKPVSERVLDDCEKLISEIKENLALERRELRRVRSLLQWVPPADMELTLLKAEVEEVMRQGTLSPSRSCLPGDPFNKRNEGMSMKQRQLPKERITALGERLIKMLDQEEDPVVVLSAVALVWPQRVAAHWPAKAAMRLRPRQRDSWARSGASLAKRLLRTKPFTNCS